DNRTYAAGERSSVNLHRGRACSSKMLKLHTRKASMRCSSTTTSRYSPRRPAGPTHSSQESVSRPKAWDSEVALLPREDPAASEAHSIGFKSNKLEECVPMSGKIAR